MAQDWTLMEPQLGPPLPKFMGIYWPWSRLPEVPVVGPPPEEGFFPAEPYIPPPTIIPIYAPSPPSPPIVIAYPPAVTPAAPYVPSAPSPPIVIAYPPAVTPAAPYVPPMPVEGPTLPDLRFEELVVSPSTVNVGEVVTVSVLARNLGDAMGSERIMAEAGELVQEKGVTLRPGESEFVNFSFIPKEPGIYNVVVGNLRGRFEALGLPDVAPPVAVAPEVTFPCPTCGKVFTTPEELAEHTRTAHPAVTPTFPCPTCGKVFSTAAQLAEHTRTAHPAVTPTFPCLVCGKVFTTPEGLARHVETAHPPTPLPVVPIPTPVVPTYPAGKDVTLTYNLTGIAKLADVAGAEHIAQLALDSKGILAKVIDVWGEGLNTVKVKVRPTIDIPKATLEGSLIDIGRDLKAQAPPPAPPPPPPTKELPRADIANYDFQVLTIPLEGFKVGDNLSWKAVGKYKGRSQGGSMTISLGVGGYGPIIVSYTYPSVATSFKQSYDWEPFTFRGNITLPSVLKKGMTYTIRARLETFTDATQETDHDYNSIHMLK